MDGFGRDNVKSVDNIVEDVFVDDGREWILR